MKIKKDFILRKMNGMNIVVAVGAAVKNFNGYINLNETGAFLWEKLASGADEDSLTDALVSEYDVDRETAARDVRAFLEVIINNDLLEN